MKVLVILKEGRDLWYENNIRLKVKGGGDMEYKKIIISIQILAIVITINGFSFKTFRRIRENNLPQILGEDFEIKMEKILAGEGNGTLLGFRRIFSEKDSFTLINDPNAQIISENDPLSPGLIFTLKGCNAIHGKVIPISKHKILSLSDLDHEVKIWDLSSRKVVTLPDNSVDSVFALSEDIIITGHKEGLIKVWDLSQGRVFILDRKRFGLPGRTVNSIYASYVGPDGFLIVSGEDLGYLNSMIFSPATGEILSFTTFMEDGGAIMNIQRYSQNSYVYSDFGRLILEDFTPREDRKPTPSIVLGKDNWIIRSFISLPDGRIATINARGQIRIWDISKVDISSTSSSSDFSSGLSGGNTYGEVSVGSLDLKNSDSYNASSISVLPDGRLVTGNEDGTIGIWDLSSKRVWFFKAHDNVIHSISVFPDGRVVSMDSNGIVKIWDITKLR